MSVRGGSKRRLQLGGCRCSDYKSDSGGKSSPGRFFKLQENWIPSACAASKVKSERGGEGEGTLGRFEDWRIEREPILENTKPAGGGGDGEEA